jgi:hypothetical protein
VVFTLASEVTGGSLRTNGFAKKHKTPCLYLSQAGGGLFSPAMQLQEFVEDHGIKVLNVAGSRESKEPGIHDWEMQVLGVGFFDG